MTDHRSTTGQRAYQLPSWFFVLTAVLSLLALAYAGWAFFGHPREPATMEATGPTVSTSPTVRPTRQPTSSPKADDGRRSGIDVVVLNASETPGLAARVADTAREAGWTVGEVGDWIYPAVINAVYYSEGHQSEAEILADDVGIESVRPARAGMNTDGLTVLLVYSP
jgi:hypothetical protein